MLKEIYDCRNWYFLLFKNVSFFSTVEAILAEERVVVAEEAFPVDEGAEVAHPRRVEAEAVEPVSRGREIMPNHAPRILAGARICY